MTSNCETHKPTPSESNPVAARNDSDSILADSMLKLSVDNRAKALEEINGIPQNCIEDLSEIKVGLKTLDNHLSDIKKGTVCEVAEAMDRQYVTGRDFRMMFLRSTRYDAPEAAERITRFLDEKRNIFGQSKLIKKITFEDLDEEAIAYLKSGALQILPERDNAGRKVLLLLVHLKDSPSLQSELRVRFFIQMCLAEPLESQLGGITIVYLALSSDKMKDSGNTGKLTCMPIHHASVHCCINDFGL